MLDKSFLIIKSLFFICLHKWTRKIVVRYNVDYMFHVKYNKVELIELWQRVSLDIYRKLYQLLLKYWIHAQYTIIYNLYLNDLSIETNLNHVDR